MTLNPTNLTNRFTIIFETKNTSIPSSTSALSFLFNNQGFLHLYEQNWQTDDVNMKSLHTVTQFYFLD